MGNKPLFDDVEEYRGYGGGKRRMEDQKNSSNKRKKEDADVKVLKPIEDVTTPLWKYVLYSIKLY